jgi:hypothetical protein
VNVGPKNAAKFPSLTTMQLSGSALLLVDGRLYPVVMNSIAQSLYLPFHCLFDPILFQYEFVSHLGLLVVLRLSTQDEISASFSSKLDKDVERSSILVDDD